MPVTTQKLGIQIIDYSEAVDLTQLINRGWNDIDPLLVSVNHQGIPAPTITTIVAAVPGGNVVSYYIVGRDTDGTGPDGAAGRRTIASATSSVGSASPMNGTNSITLTGNLPALHEYQTIEIIRSAGGPSQGKVATLTVAGATAWTFTDSGVAATAYTAPTRNETADLVMGGYLGVGTTNPQAKQHVVGQSRIESATYPGQYIQLGHISASNYGISLSGFTMLEIQQNLLVDGTFGAAGTSTLGTTNIDNLVVHFSGVYSSGTNLNLTAAALRLPLTAPAASSGSFGLNGSTLQYYDGAATRSLVDLSLTQTLTNKTLTAPAISGPILTGSATGSGAIDITGTIHTTSYIAAGPPTGVGSGDLSANRNNGTAFLWLANTSHFLEFDGSNYQLPNGNLFVNSSQVVTLNNGAVLTLGPYTSDWFHTIISGNGIVSDAAGTGIYFTTGNMGPQIYGGTFATEFIQSRGRHDGSWRQASAGGVTLDASLYDGGIFSTGSSVTLPAIATAGTRSFFIKNVTGSTFTVNVTDGNGIYDTTWRTSYSLAQGASIIVVASQTFGGYMLIANF